MNAPANESNKRSLSLEPLLGWVRLDGHWRGKVLLGLGDGAEIFGQPWPTVTAEDWERAVSNPSKLFEPGTEEQVLKDGDGSKVVLRELKLGESQVEVVCKLSRRQSRWRRVVGVLQRSRGNRNWRMGWELLAEGIPTALPVAVLEKRILGLRVGAIIITRSLFPGKNLEHFMVQEGASLEPDVIRELMRELVELIGRLHKRNFFHRDLKGVNIFVRPACGHKTCLCLIDLDGCHHGGQKYGKKVKSLGRLVRSSLNWTTVSPSVRLRFLKMYLRECGQDQKDWKRWWRNIDSEVHRKLLLRKKRSESA